MLTQWVALTVLFVSTALASPAVTIRKSPVTLPFARRINATSVRDLLKIDQARAKAFKNRPQVQQRITPASAAAFGVPATNQAVDYILEVGVGNPPTTFDLLVDTGSSNTWVGAGKALRTTSTTQATGNLVQVTYGSGFVFGSEVIDQVTLAPGLVIENQSIGSAILSQGFDGLDGIIGIGPTDLTCGTLFPDTAACISTVTDSAFSLGLLDAHEVGISFEPTNSLSSTNGEIIFGGIDDSKFTGDINFVPITSTSPANMFVGIDQSITYGAAGTPILASTSGITDTGTTLLLIASDALTAYEAGHWSCTGFHDRSSPSHSCSIRQPREFVLHHW
ncbi:hypothetical protein QCA50_016587 [Cerrena zonata]|uniref:Peptidase A1 domain-containing protein n=1 Tax=Cerrena zonata TaxID=2478898 RepID=A0AAW0FJH1_9APHY